MMRVAFALMGFGLVLGFVGWRTTGRLESFALAVPGALIAAATAAHRIAALSHLFMILAFGSIGWLLGYPALGLLAGIGYAVFAEFSSRKLPGDFGSDTILPTAADAVGEGAEGFVEEFTGLGYRQVGALTFRVQGHEIVESIMIGPASDRYAMVTDAIIAITSRFGDRSLITRNSALSRMPPDMLDNPLQGGSPQDLDSCHSDALAILARRVQPEEIDPTEVTALAIHDEKRAVEFARSLRTHLIPGGGAGHGPLASNAAAEQLIAEWLSPTDQI